MKHLMLLGNKLALHVASDRYEVLVVRGDKARFRISSEEKIGYVEEVTELRKEFMEKNRVVGYHFVMLVDVKLNWSMHCVKDSQDEGPFEILRGKFVSEKHQLKQLIGAHYLDGKILLSFDNCRIFYLALPKALIENKPSKQQEGKYLINKEFVPYGQEPRYEHQEWAVNRGFLPQEEQYQLTLTHYSILSEDLGLLLIALKSKSNGLSSIYSMEYHRKSAQLVSGRNVMLNLKGKVITVQSTEQKGVYLLQTEENLIVWRIQIDQKQATLEMHSDLFVSRLTKFRGKSGLQFVGVTEDNKVSLISISKTSLKRTSLPIPLSENHQILQVFIFNNPEQQYILTKKQQLFFSNSKEPLKKIISNEHTQITESRLAVMPSHNFLIISKVRGAVREKIIFGHHLFAFDGCHYAHGLMLNSAECLEKGNSNLQGYVFLTSPLIGLAKFNISLKESSKEIKSSSKDQNKQLNNICFEMTHDKQIKYSSVQTLFLNDKYQITAQEILDQTKRSATKIEKLFDGAIDFISLATVLSDEFIILAISQQIHVYDTKFNRRYIYCFNSQIKKIYNLNDINVIGVELYQSETSSEANDLTVLILEQDKASKLKNIEIPDDCFKFIQLHTVINTSEYKINMFGGKIVLCSNDSLHKYQLDKIVVDEFDLPLPMSNLENCQVIALHQLTKEKNQTQFMVIFREERLDVGAAFDNVEVYIGSFSPKYLLKKVDLGDLHVNYQRVLTLSELPHDYPLFAVSATSAESLKGVPAVRHLGIVGQKHFSMFSTKFGKIELEWLEDKRYMLTELQKIESIPRQIVQASTLLPIEQPLKIVPTSKSQFLLLFNSRQLYYAHYQTSKMTTISYYSLINDDFSTFRNNLALSELNSPEFMATFSQKMRIKSLKYLSDQLIFVLYEYCIVVLEIGLNNSLVVKQELKFRGNESTEVIKIEEFLQNWDEKGIYLRQGNGRIYLLVAGPEGYEIKFHSYMDEDVLLFGRLTNWHQRQRTFNLRPKQQEKIYDELVLKKDGQLIITSSNAAHDPNKLVYL